MPSRRIHSPVRRRLVRTDQVLRQELVREVDLAAAVLLRLGERVVARWSRKPKFRTERSITSRGLSVRVLPDRRSKAGKIYAWIDQGTGKWGPNKAAYQIPKVLTAQSKLLRFRTGYIPKTAPVAKTQPGGGRYTGGWVSKRSVMHPGIESRKFSETFSKRLKPSFDRRIENAIRRAIRRANSS